MNNQTINYTQLHANAFNVYNMMDCHIKNLKEVQNKSANLDYYTDKGIQEIIENLELYMKELCRDVLNENQSDQL